MKKQLFALFILLLLSFSVNSQWIVQSYNPTMPGAYFINGSNTGWVAADNGNIRKTLDGGATWSSITTGNQLQLNEIFFINNNTGWAVGNTGTILYSTNGGNNWAAQSSGTINHLYEVRFIDNNTGFAAGNSLHRTTNGGANWSAVADPSFNGIIYTLAVRNANLIYMSMSTNKVFKSTNAGVNWNLISSLPNAINDMYFLDDNTGYGAGNLGTVYKTTNGGVNWDQYTTTSTNALKSIIFLNATTGFTCGVDNTIIRTTNSGVNWSTVVNTLADVYDLSLYGTNQVFACGQWGVLYNTSVGATAWNQLFQGRESSIKDIFFINTMTGWAANNSNVVLATTNGGLNWQTTGFGNMPGKTHLYFLNSSTGFVLGSPSNDAGTERSIGKTTNGGLNFTETFVPAVNSNGIQFVNANDGFAMFEEASENAALYRTTNAGDNWQLVNSANNNFIGFYFTTQLNGWMCGINGGMMKTTNGGINWSPQTTGVTEYLYSVYFQNGNFGWACGTGGRIIATTNGGTSWSIQSSGTTSPLTDIKFTSTTNGICVGDNGVRLITTNGGANWVNNNDPSQVQFEGIFYASPTQVYTYGQNGYVAVSPAITGIEPVNSNIPNTFSLQQNYPNPFNPSTKIEFSVPKSQHVKLTVFDITGKTIAELVNTDLNAGNYSIPFTAEGLSSGVYFYRLNTNEFTETKKMILIK